VQLIETALLTHSTDELLSVMKKQTKKNRGPHGVRRSTGRGNISSPLAAWCNGQPRISCPSHWGQSRRTTPSPPTATFQSRVNIAVPSRHWHCVEGDGVDNHMRQHHSKYHCQSLETNEACTSNQTAIPLQPLFPRHTTQNEAMHSHGQDKEVQGLGIALWMQLPACLHNVKQHACAILLSLRQDVGNLLLESVHIAVVCRRCSNDGHVSQDHLRALCLHPGPPSFRTQ